MLEEEITLLCSVSWSTTLIGSQTSAPDGWVVSAKMCLQNSHERGAKKNVEHSRQECLEKARTVMKEVSGTSRKAMEDTCLEKSGQVMKNVPTCAIGSLLHWWQKTSSSRRSICCGLPEFLLSYHFHHQLLMCIFSVSWKSIKGLMCSILSPAQTLREDAK